MSSIGGGDGLVLKQQDTDRSLLGSDISEKIHVEDDEQVIILSLSSVWLKGLITMNVAIFVAVIIMFVIQCKKCLDDCMHIDGGSHGSRRHRNKYNKLMLTTDVTEFETASEDAILLE